MNRPTLQKIISISLIAVALISFAHSSQAQQISNTPQGQQNNNNGFGGGTNTTFFNNLSGSGPGTSPGTFTGGGGNVTPPAPKPTQTPPATGGDELTGCTIGLSWNGNSCINHVAAWVVNLSLEGTALLVAGAAAILNVSINMTLHIKDFVNATPAIYTVWKTIRDISGIFFIFFLLYAAIQMILGDEAKFGHTIKNIVVAGILINFSFFLVSLAIDASNIVSVAIYNQMVPATALTIQAPNQNGQGGTTLSQITQATTGIGQSNSASSNGSGGIATIFAESLKITKFYDPANQGATGKNALNPLKIVFIGTAGVIMMVTTALSFVLAAGVFIIRLVILIFILAFSPLLFLSWMSPQLAAETKKIANAFKNQVIFMPVYLLLMYMALAVLSGSNIIGSASVPTASDNNWLFGYIVLFVNFFIVIFMLNLPLVAGLTMSGHVSNKLLGKFDAKTIWQGFGRKVGSQAGNRTFGRLAYGANERLTPKLTAFSPLLGSVSNSAFSSVSKAGFGEKKGSYEDRLKAKNKAREELHKKIGQLDESRYDNTIRDADGKTELDRAKALAKQQQGQYREKLPWKKGFPGGVIGFMVDNRANKQSAGKLNKEAAKQAKKDAKKAAQGEKNTLIKEKERLPDEARVKAINARLEELEETIREGKEVEDEERDKKILDKLDDIDKKGGSGGGGGDKGDKKEEGK